MMQNNLEKLKIATSNYRLNDDVQIAENVLLYLKQRIKANQKEIEDLLKIKKEKVTYEQIENIFMHEIEKDIKYKNYKQLAINKDKFISTSLLMPIGVIAVETYETTEVIKYFIQAIKTRNAIAISDVEYDEQSVKFLILEIFKEALKKFRIDENLIMILPYEECYYSYFDKVIYTYNKQGKKLRQNDYEKKKTIDKKYLYIENSELEEIALKDNQNIEILYGSIDIAIQKINQKPSIAASIYTKDAKKAYSFINLVNSENVLVNTSLENIKKIENSPYELYTYRNIILPMPQKDDKEETIEFEKEQEISLQVINKTIFEKIKDILKRIFNK